MNENKASQKGSVANDLTDLHPGDKYVPLNQWDVNWAFCHTDFKIDDKDTEHIKPLNEQFSSQLWERFICKRSRHLALLDKDEWPKSLTIADSIYNWQDDWNQHNAVKFQGVLTKNVSIGIDSTILFFWMKETAIETSWGTFLKYWINFLFNDEYPILISVETKDVIIFGPLGQTWIGKRPNKI